MTTSSAGPDNYPLGRSKEETQRLISAAEMGKRSISRFLEDAGITTGMHVLDLGCGAGDISLALAGMVGPTGRVVGIDLNGTILDTARRRVQEAGLTNVSFVNVRVPDTTGLEGTFDALVGRRVLCYIPSPHEAIQALLPFLRSGAVVAFQEVDWTVWKQTSYPLVPYYEQVFGWISKGFAAGGTDMAMGTNLLRTFVDAGLPEPFMKAEAGIGSGAESSAHLSGLLRSMRDRLMRDGIATAEELDIDAVVRRMNEESAAVNATTTGGFEVCAWTTKP